MFVEKSGGITERLLITGKSSFSVKKFKSHSWQFEYLVNRLFLGVSIKELFASILLYQVVIHVIQTVGVLCITYYIFGNPLKGSVVTLTTLLVLVGMVGSLFGEYYRNYIQTHFKPYGPLNFSVSSGYSV